MDFLIKKLLLELSAVSIAGGIAAFFSGLAAALFAAAALKQIFITCRKVPDMEGLGSGVLHRRDISAAAASTAALLVILFTFLLLSYLKLHQYYGLETWAFDHGLEANVAWNTVHGNGFYGSVHDKNYMGSDHFSPIQAVTGALFYLWEDAAMLLLAQVAGIALSAAALYRLALRITGERLLSLIFLPLFLFSPYLHMVNRFDYHPVALALPAYLWALYFMETRRAPWFIAAVLIALMTTEKAPLDIAGLAAFMCLKKDMRRAGIVLLVFSIVLFVLEIKVIMPFYNDGKGMMHFDRYDNLGKGLDGIVLNLVKNPMLFLRESFLHAGKMESLVLLSMSCGFLPLSGGLALVTVVAAAMSNLLSGYDGQWQFKAHYSASVLPFLLYASLCGASNIRNMLGRRFGAQRAGAAVRYLVAAFSMLNLTAVLLFVPYPGGRGEAADVGEFLRIKRGFDKRAAVCAQSPLVPHLAMRKYVYMFDTDRGQKRTMPAEYIVFDVMAGFAPYGTREDLLEQVADVLRGKTFGVEYAAQGVIVLKKGHERSQNAVALEYVEGQIRSGR